MLTCKSKKSCTHAFTCHQESRIKVNMQLGTKTQRFNDLFSWVPSHAHHDCYLNLLLHMEGQDCDPR